MNGYGSVWTEEKVKSELLSCIDTLQIDRMPTAAELVKLGRIDLHNKVSKTRKYSGWADFLGLKRKDSDTLFGQSYEYFVRDELVRQGFTAEKMTTKHPYDLLVNDTVKIDVKTGKAYMLRGESRVHSFGINKKEPTCDIYIILAIDEKDKVERTLIIPSHFLKVISLCIGKESKYNRFIDKWEYIEQYSKFFKGVS